MTETLQMKISEMAMRHRTEADAPANICDCDAAFTRQVLDLVFGEEFLEEIREFAIGEATPQERDLVRSRRHFLRGIDAVLKALRKHSGG